MVRIEQSVIDQLGGVEAVAEAVAAHLAAVEAHRFTVGEAAPVAPPVIAAIIEGGGMEALEIYQTPDTPPTPRRIPSLEFRRRFTPAERGAITLAASRALDRGDPTLQVWLDDCNAAGDIHLDADEVSGALELLVAAGLLTEERKGQVLA